MQERAAREQEVNLVIVIARQKQRRIALRSGFRVRFCAQIASAVHKSLSQSHVLIAPQGMRAGEQRREEREGRFNIGWNIVTMQTVYVPLSLLGGPGGSRDHEDAMGTILLR